MFLVKSSTTSNGLLTFFPVISERRFVAYFAPVYKDFACLYFPYKAGLIANIPTLSNKFPMLNFGLLKGLLPGIKELVNKFPSLKKLIPLSVIFGIGASSIDCLTLALFLSSLVSGVTSNFLPPIIS